MSSSNINWYPGHMKKASRMMEDSLPLVDAIVEIRDSRIPESSRNPDIDKIGGKKPRLIILNRADQADPSVTSAWSTALTHENQRVLAMDCKSGKGIDSFVPSAKSLLQSLLEKQAGRGMVGRPLRFMVVGIPNVGKSSFINRLAGRKAAEAGDKPGVTRGKQWISLGSGIQLLDTPGILWPKFDSETVGLHLAWTGAINDNILDIEYVASALLERLSQYYPECITERYKIDSPSEYKGYELLELAGKKRGFLVSGGEINTERMAHVLLDEFRAAKLGRITLERPAQT